MQRKFLTVAFVLLLTAQVLSSAAKGISCPNSNPFIKLMKEANATLHEKPVLSNSLCGFEFEQYGSCCQLNDLRQYAQRDTEEIAASVKLINQEYKHFQGMMPKIFSLIKQIALAPIDPNNRSMNSKIRSAEITLKDMKTARAQMWFKTVAAATEHSDMFEEANTECWKMQEKARRVALCYTCSGRSRHFFNMQKALISVSTCQEFVKSCSYPLSTLVKFIKTFEGFNFLRFRLPNLGIDINIDSKLNTGSLSKYFRALKNEGIFELVDAVQKYSTPELQAQMCSKFLRLGEKPIISQMRTIFKSSQPWKIEIPKIATYLAEHKKQISIKMEQFNRESNIKFANEEAPWRPASTNSNWGLSRLLQFNGVAFESDSKIIDVTDPSYKSVGVSGKSPMELSQEFP